MVDVRVYRGAIEALADAPPRAKVARQEVESVTSDDGSPELARVYRGAIEVMAKVPARVGVPRQEVESVTVDNGGTAQVDVSRLAIEVLTKTPLRASVARQEVESVTSDDGSPELARIYRNAIEVMMRSSVPAPAAGISVTPIEGILDFFLHNWATQFELETIYNTDVKRSPQTGTETRRGRLQRPRRVGNFRWTGQDVDSDFVDRLLVTLRRFTRDRLPVPIAADVTVLSANSTSAENVLRCDNQNRRFFIGGRVVVFPIGGQFDDTLHLEDQVKIYTITNSIPGELVVGGTLGIDLTRNRWVVAPLMDCERLPNPRWTMLNTDSANARLSFREFVGKSSLPPVVTGLPDGWQNYQGLPILEPDHDWSEGMDQSYKLRSRSTRVGRREVLSQESPREIVETSYAFTMHRADWWNILNFFDSRRGRQRAFWQVDQQWQWDVVDTDPFFISVNPKGRFEDFNEQWDWAGIVMKDGTVYIRPVVVVADQTSTWRLTLSTDALPGIDVTQISRFARARKVRFSKDSLLERWSSNNAVQVSFGTTELLNEQDIEIG